MAAGFPLKVNGIRIRTSEALYQACRFPHRPDVQHRIIDARSPMTAKMRSKPFRKESRLDWNEVRVQIMRWCLRVKLAENWRNFGTLLLATGDCPIVERSRRDDFWGTKVAEDGTLVGMNVLGRLLMELRGQFRAKTSESLRIVEPVSIPEFLLLRKPINTVYTGKSIDGYAEAETRPTPAIEVLTSPEPLQQSFFNRPVVTQAQTESQKVLTAENVRRDMPEPYPSYWDSGMPWLGLIPEHWETKRAKRLFQKMERPVTESDEVVTCFRDGIVTLRKNRRVSGFTESLKEIGYQGIRRGDLVIHGMDAFAGAIGVADSDGKGTPVYSVCKPGPTANAQYYAYTLREMARSRWIQALAKGIRERSTDFRFESFGSQQVPLPTIPEQTAIVRYLDHVDRRIQRYIRAKQKLIALLEEQKQAVIHQAVTGRIDVRTGRPYPAYKPSGVEWLGKVPEHWGVWQIGHLGRVGNGSTPSRSNRSYWDGGTYPWLNSSSVNHSPITKADQFVTDLALRECHLPQIQPGSVLVAITGQGKTRGTSAVLDTEATINQHVAYVTPRNDMIGADYLQLVLLAAYHELRAISDDSGSTKGALTCWDISHFRVPLPPRAEQAEIVLATRQATKTLESASGKAAQEVMLAREYRTRLIADVVTGKLDVRGAAPNLPHKINEAEQLVDIEDLTDETEVLDGSFLYGHARQVCTTGDENRKTIRK